MSRFIKEIPQDLLDGYDEVVEERTEDKFEDSSYKWEYGRVLGGKIKTYKVEDQKVQNVAMNVDTNKSSNGFAFRTAESFLKSFETNKEIDVNMYQAGQRVYHKKFGEGTINKVEKEGEDLKVDICFDKVGNKRLMAKFAGLQII